MEISVSDIRTFQRCRRRWDLTSPNRQSLTKAAKEAYPIYFFVGSVAHKAIEYMALNQFDQHTVDRAFDSIIAEYEKKYREVVGMGFSPLELRPFEDQKPLLKCMVEGYVDRYSTEGSSGHATLKNMHYIMIEAPYMVLIPDCDDPNDEEAYLRGTFDGVAYDPTHDDYWIIEHKTYSTPPKEDDLYLDSQFLSYQWAFEKLTGIVPRGVIYDGMAKKIPTEPRLLQNGTMSRAKINTTARVYADALEEAGLNVDDYADFLVKLKETEVSEDSPFYRRYKIPFYRNSNIHTEQWLRDVYGEMANPHIPIYPHRPYNGCWDCPVQDVCDAMTYGEDADYLLSDYVKAEPYGSFSSKDPWTPDSPSRLTTIPLHLQEEAA